MENEVTFQRHQSDEDASSSEGKEHLVTAARNSAEELKVMGKTTTKTHHLIPRKS